MIGDISQQIIEMDMAPPNTRKGDWVQTYTGRRYWPLDPVSWEVHFEDIAHALSFLCRFGGHCREFYSVAQHSVIVSHYVPPLYRMAALLHDASEAYVADVTRPVKRTPEFAVYNEIERRNTVAIYQRFAVPFADVPAIVKDADVLALATEKRDLMAPMDWGNNRLPTPAVERIVPLAPEAARASFIARFLELGGDPTL